MIRIQNTHYLDNDDTLVSLLCITDKLDVLSSEACLAAMEFLLWDAVLKQGMGYASMAETIVMSSTPFGQVNEYFGPNVPYIAEHVTEVLVSCWLKATYSTPRQARSS